MEIEKITAQDVRGALTAPKAEKPASKRGRTGTKKSTATKSNAKKAASKKTNTTKNKTSGKASVRKANTQKAALDLSEQSSKKEDFEALVPKFTAAIKFVVETVPKLRKELNIDLTSNKYRADDNLKQSIKKKRIKLAKSIGESLETCVTILRQLVSFSEVYDKKVRFNQDDLLDLETQKQLFRIGYITRHGYLTKQIEGQPLENRLKHFTENLATRLVKLAALASYVHPSRKTGKELENFYQKITGKPLKPALDAFYKKLNASDNDDSNNTKVDLNVQKWREEFQGINFSYYNTESLKLRPPGPQSIKIDAKIITEIIDRTNTIKKRLRESQFSGAKLELQDIISHCKNLEQGLLGSGERSLLRYLQAISQSQPKNWPPAKKKALAKAINTLGSFKVLLRQAKMAAEALLTNLKDGTEAEVRLQYKDNYLEAVKALKQSSKEGTLFTNLLEVFEELPVMELQVKRSERSQKSNTSPW